MTDLSRCNVVVPIPRQHSGQYLPLDREVWVRLLEPARLPTAEEAVAFGAKAVKVQSLADAMHDLAITLAYVIERLDAEGALRLPARRHADCVWEFWQVIK